MRKYRNILSCAVIALFGIVYPVHSSENNGMPPLIDREIFFGNPEIMGGQLSPDGEWITFLKPYEGVRNIWIKKANEPFENARPLTASEKRPIPGYFWSWDSQYLLYVQDRDGDENYHVYALDPHAEVPDGAVVPEARNLTDAEGARASIYRVSKNDPDLMYVGLNDRDSAWHDLYEVRISTGERRLLFENTQEISSWTFDTEDQLRLVSKSTPEGGTQILAIEGEELRPIFECSVEETAYIAHFHPDGDKAYLVTNRGDSVDLTRLMYIDPVDGSVELIEQDPEGAVDLGGAWFSDLTDTLIATTYRGDKTRRYFKDKEWEADYLWLQEQLPGYEIGIGSSTFDETQFFVNAYSDTDPGSTYLFDRNARTLEFQYRPRPRMPIADLAPMQPIRYESSDGLQIPAYLTLPVGLEPKALPLVVFPHGGPWSRDYWGYHSYAQFLANRGYAVLLVNFRGSTGFGKSFLNAGNDQWGDLMQDDLTWGVKHLVNEGIVDPERVGIMGGSYGGYATLAGMTFTPELYAAGVSIVGPSNLLTLLDSIPAYWESFRRELYERVGDPSIEAERERLIRQSPLNSADQIRAPLMIVQGKNDPRVKEAESEQIVVAMRDLGLDVEYINAPDEGHGFSRPVNNMAFLAAAEKFFAQHLGGRYQESMPEDVAQRLGEITVDITTVSLASED